MKTLTEFLKLSSGKKLDLNFPIKLCNKNGDWVYFENFNGYWVKHEYDKSGNEIYFEDSTGYWFKSEYEDGKEVYYENSTGHIDDSRVKEMSKSEIEKALGFKVKITTD